VADESELWHEYLDALIVLQVESAQVSYCKLLHLLSQL